MIADIFLLLYSYRFHS